MAFGQHHIFNRFQDAQINTLPFTKDNTFYVFPFELVLGFINQTEAGINDNIGIYDFNTYQRVFTGLENVIARWEGAYNVYQKNNSDLFLTKEYSVGRSLNGYINSKDLATVFRPSRIDSSFTTQMTDESITVYFEDELAEFDLFKLYIIPEMNSFKWLYIQSLTKYYDNNKTFLYSEVTFANLNNAIASSGRAVEEFVHFGAAGEGYAYPSIDNDRNITVDIVKMKDLYVQSFQVEISGPAAIGSLYCWGRPTISEINEDGVIVPTFNPKIEAPRRLLIQSLETPIASPINTKPVAETSYFWGTFQPTLWEQYNTWKEQFTNNYSMSDRSQYEGVLINPSFDEIKKSNPLAVDGAHSYILWDSDWRIAITNLTFDTKADNMTNDSITLNGSLTIVDILNHTSFFNNQIDSIPPSIEQLTSWGTSDIPLVGGFLSKITLGIPLGWRDLAVRVKTPKIPFIIPTTLVKYGNVMRNQQSSSDVFIPMEIFTGSLQSDQILYSGINAMGTIIKVALTDRFSKIVNSIKYIFNTRDLGQDHPTVDDDGTPVTGTLPEKLYWTSTCSAVPRKAIGFIIDSTTWKGLAKLNYRTTFFSSGNIQIWSGTYKTQSLFTGSMADWNNTMKLSNWQTTDSKVISYPKDIIEPAPPDQNLPNVMLLDYINQKTVYNSNLTGTASNSFTTFPIQLRNWLARPENIEYVGGPQTATKLTGRWVKQGYRYGQYDLTKIGGVQRLAIDYEFLIITIQPITDGITTESLTPFTIKVPTNDIISRVQIDYDLKKDGYWVGGNLVRFTGFSMDDVSIVNNWLQVSNFGSPSTIQVSAKGNKDSLYYIEQRNTIFRILLQGNILKFGWNENIVGYIPNQRKLNDNRPPTTTGVPADPTFNFMYISGAFGIIYDLSRYKYKSENNPFVQYAQIQNCYLQAKKIT